MRILAWTADCVLIGAALGWLAGRTTHPQPPLTAVAGPLPGVEAEPPAGHKAALFADPTATAAPAQPSAPSGAATADRAVQGQAPGVPAAAAAEVPPPSGILVLPHGPGHFASLQLEAAGLTQLTVYQGSMVRDGLAHPPAILRAPKVATLRGSEVRVELLHLGFDRDAQPIAAHVRLTEGPAAGSEGIALLRVARKGQPEAVVQLRPLAGEAVEPGEASERAQPTAEE
jgi:hypothetical protein